MGYLVGTNKHNPAGILLFIDVTSCLSFISMNCETRIFEPKRGENGEWRKFHNEKLHYLKRKKIEPEPGLELGQVQICLLKFINVNVQRHKLKGLFPLMIS